MSEALNLQFDYVPPLTWSHELWVVTRRIELGKKGGEGMELGHLGGAQSRTTVTPSSAFQASGQDASLRRCSRHFHLGPWKDSILLEEQVDAENHTLISGPRFVNDMWSKFLLEIQIKSFYLIFDQVRKVAEVNHLGKRSLHLSLSLC